MMRIISQCPRVKLDNGDVVSFPPVLKDYDYHYKREAIWRRDGKTLASMESKPHEDLEDFMVRSIGVLKAAVELM